MAESLEKIRLEALEDISHWRFGSHWRRLTSHWRRMDSRHWKRLDGSYGD